MRCRTLLPTMLVALVLLAGTRAVSPGQAQELIPTLPAAHMQQSFLESPATEGRKGDYELGCKDGDLVAESRPAFVPVDPCLEPLYKNWYEFSADAKQEAEDTAERFVAFRIVLDRSTFRLKFLGLRPSGDVKKLYESACGIGQLDSPTPEGTFFINHVYTYPDAAYFDSSGAPHRGLYNGFFAPLLACDEGGMCKRFQELGIHGFNPVAYPDPSAIRREICGAVSGGCIRLPDPCGFKVTLIRLVGIGPAKKNDRGVYHWLKEPVEVIIRGYYPGTDDFGAVVSLFEQGLGHVRDGLKSLFGGFGP